MKKGKMNWRDHCYHTIHFCVTVEQLDLLFFIGDREVTIPCMLASLQGSQDDKSLNSLFFPAIISVKDKYTMCVTKTTPFWITDSLVRVRQSCAYVLLLFLVNIKGQSYASIINHIVQKANSICN